jgi:hypothetical protein
MLISTLKMDQWLMAVTASEAIMMHSPMVS